MRKKLPPPENTLSQPSQQSQQQQQQEDYLAPEDYVVQDEIFKVALAQPGCRFTNNILAGCCTSCSLCGLLRCPSYMHASHLHPVIPTNLSSLDDGGGGAADVRQTDTEHKIFIESMASGAADRAEFRGGRAAEPDEEA